MGFIFGKIALKRMIKDDKPLDKNVPTTSDLKIKGNGNIKIQKTEWTKLITEYANFSNPAFIHDFFGRMTKEQIGILAYKHTDHHLRQFGTFFKKKRTTNKNIVASVAGQLNFSKVHNHQLFGQVSNLAFSCYLQFKLFNQHLFRAGKQ